MTKPQNHTILEMKENLAKAVELSIRLYSLSDKQLVIMFDASEHAAGYVLLIKDYTESKIGTTKSYPLVVLGSQQCREGQMSVMMYAKEFLAIHFAIDELVLILWGAKKPTIMMKTLGHLPVLPRLLNSCDQALQFDFVLAHVLDTENPAADYLSRLNIRPEDRILLNLNDGIPIFHVEIDLSSESRRGGLGLHT